MLLRINPHNPQERLLQQAVDILQNDGILIYPTDTVYALGCDIKSKKALERICRIKNIDPEKFTFACICEEVGIVGEYAMQVSTPVYKLLKSALPGPYTFILKASKNIPRHFQSRRKTVGIRVADHKIPTALVHLLGNPILTTSLREENEGLDYPTDPEYIEEKYRKLVDAVIDGGPGGILPSTVLDCSEGEDKIRLIRTGLGDLEKLNIVVRDE